MAFGAGGIPSGYVMRTFRVKVMANKGRRERAYGLLVAAGDAWAWTIDRFHDRHRQGLPNANSLEELWPDQKAHGSFGDLTAHCAQDVTKAWSAAFFEATRRRRGGKRASLPTKKHHFVSVRWRKDEFSLTPSAPGRRARVELSTRRGTMHLVLALSHDHPYDPERIREVKLVDEAGNLYLDITGLVAISPVATNPTKVSGTDPGIIHPLVTSILSPDADCEALVVSGRALRFEEFCHLEDTKARQRVQSATRRPQRARPGHPRVEGSRRWRKIAHSQRKAEARSQRRVRQAIDRSARLTAEFLVVNQVHTVAIGDPRGVRARNSGRVQNRRTNRWAVGRSIRNLGWRLEGFGYMNAGTFKRGDLDTSASRLVGMPIRIVPSFGLVTERGTSSRCPTCRHRATKLGRKLTCQNPECRRRHHRDVAGSKNIALLLFNDETLADVRSDIAHIEHRRVGSPARRDHRRALFEQMAKVSPTSSSETSCDPVVLPVPGPPEDTQESHAMRGVA